MTVEELQSRFPDGPPKRPRKGRAYRPRKRLTAEQRPGVLSQWLTQNMLVPYLAGAQLWKRDEGSQIADDAGNNVNENGAWMDNDNGQENIKQAIKKARAMKIPARDIIEGLYRATRRVAYDANDTIGWTSTYFGEVVDLVIQVYPREKAYGEELKRKALRGQLTV